jgi:hypothetical protein
VERPTCCAGVESHTAGASTSEGGMGWEKGQTLFQEDLHRAKGDQEYLEYFSMIDFAVDCYAFAYASASFAFPDNPALKDWAINGYMLLWRQHFLTEDVDLAE